MPYSVFVTRRLTPEAEDKLNAFCQAEYWPKETPPSIIDGTWKIPAIHKVE